MKCAFQTRIFIQSLPAMILPFSQPAFFVLDNCGMRQGFLSATERGRNG